MKNYILAIDQGTTGTTALIIDENIQIAACSTKNFKQYFPKQDWVEHNPDEIWQSVLEAIAEAIAKARINAKNIIAIGITNQRETALVWDKNTNETLHNAIVWQCNRTADYCKSLQAQNLEPIIKQKTGLIINPYFSASKYRWILDNLNLHEKARNNQIALANIDTFLLWQLTDKNTFSTDFSNASRTSLMNLHTLDWDDELLEIFNIPKQTLPQITPNATILGYTKNVPGLPDNIPISGSAGDQQAALFGQTAFNRGEAKCTFGTGSFLLVNTGEQIHYSDHGLLTTLAWSINGTTKYALEGSTFIAGALVQWLRDGLQIINNPDEIEELAASVPSTESVIFVPALTGLGAPHWHPNAKATITGLTRATTKAHIARAALEGICHQNTDLIEAMTKDLKTPLQNLKVDGGASKNNLLMQIQADLLQLNLIRPKIIQTTALGAALMAGIGIGIYKNQEDIIKSWEADAVFQPLISPEKKDEHRNNWKKAIPKTLP